MHYDITEEKKKELAKTYLEEYNKRRNGLATHRIIQEDLWCELMEKYHLDQEERTRDIGMILSDIKHYSGFEKVKQSYYSALCNGKGVRKVREKIDFQLRIDVHEAIENKDKGLFDSIMYNVRHWIKAKYIEIYLNHP